MTFPFDSENAGAQPESVARVVRCVKSDGAAASWGLAVQFAGIRFYAAGTAGSGRNGRDPVHAPNGNGHGGNVALPIRVRPKTIPWHEDAMTVEISSDKLKFQTNREYQFGERLMVSFAAPTDLPWDGPFHGDGEWETEVVGIETAAGSDRLQVTLRRKTG